MQPTKTTLVLTTAAAILPSALAVPAALAAPTATAAGSRTVSGPAAHMRWGDVSVRIRVSGRKLVAITISAPTERPKSARINGRAVPLLRSEALRSQSSRVATVSGATMTSKAFSSSLAAALRTAGI